MSKRFCPSAPPRRTVRTDFPYTALRQSLATQGMREELMALTHLKIYETIPLKSFVQSLTRAKRFASPLAPVLHKPAEPTSYKMVNVPKHLAWITIVEIIGPAPKDYIGFTNCFLQWLFISTTGLYPHLILKSHNGFLGWKYIQVAPVATFQIPVITKRKPQKIEAFPDSLHLYNARLIPVHFQSKTLFKLLIHPSYDQRPDVSCQYHKIIGVPNQLCFRPLTWPASRFMKSTIKFMEIDVGQQRRDDAPLGSTLTILLYRFLSFVVCLHHRTLKPHSNQFQHRTICNPPLEHLHQPIVGYCIKIARKIRIIHFLFACFETRPDLIQRHVCTPFRAKPVGTVQKISLKDRLNHQQHCHLHNTIPYAGDAQRPLLAVGFGNIDASHRFGPVGAAPKRLIDLIDKRHNPSLTGLDVVDTNTINTRCTLVGSHAFPRRFQYVPTIHTIIEHIEPKRRFSLGLKAQFPSQQGDLNRHTGLLLEPLCLIIRNGVLTTQAGSPFLDRNMTEVRPLGSTPFPGLLRYYEPLRLPTAATMQVIDSLQMLSNRLTLLDTTSGLPGPSTDLSVRALSNHPGRLGRCSRSFLPCRWQASPHLEGWPPPVKCNEAESSSLSLGLTPSLSSEYHSLSPSDIYIDDRPTPRVRLPCTRDRNYMLNELLTCPTLLSRIDQPGFPWHTRVHRVF